VRTHRLHFFVRCWLAVLMVVSASAWAHSSSNSYLTLSAVNDDLVLRSDISLRDVDMALDLDSNQDQRITWGEISAQQTRVVAWLQDHLQARWQDQSCPLQLQDLMASEHADGWYVSALWHLPCAGLKANNAEGLVLRYQLMFDQDNLHRGLLKVDLAQPSSAIFSPDQAEVRIGGATVSGWEVLHRYVLEGVWHIWIGADHILFLLSLLILAPLIPASQRVTQWAGVTRIQPAFVDVLGVVTAFTVAHSITLGVSVLKIFEPPASVVEPIIALSVVVAALNNLMGHASQKRWRLAFLFGLIHGFGFAFVLVDLGLPAQQLALALGGFNLGVELGQLAIVLSFMPLAMLLRHTAFYRWGVVVGGSFLIAGFGSFWLYSRLVA